MKKADQCVKTVVGSSSGAVDKSLSPAASAYQRQRAAAIAMVRSRASSVGARQLLPMIAATKHPLSEAIRVTLLAAGIVVWGGTTLEAENCSSSDCEAAPYSLTIINHGEGKPRSSNHTAEGRQDNRRVDVGVVVQVPDGVAGEEMPPVVSAAKPLSNDGSFWITRDPSSLDRLLDLQLSATAGIDESGLTSPLTIKILTNYWSFLERWEIIIKGSNRPEQTIDAGTVRRANEFDWDGSLLSMADLAFEHNDEVEISVRVYDRDGNYDQTQFQSVRFVHEDRVTLTDNLKPDDAVSIETLNNSGGDGYSVLAFQSIPLSGARVRIHGQQIDGAKSLLVNSEEVRLKDGAAFLYEALMPPGEHSFDISVTDSSGRSIDKPLSVTVDDHYFFMVGLADLTVGGNNVSGSIEQLAVDEEHFDGDLFVDGRLAFYLKGKVKGKYLITAQLDTGTDSIESVFDDFHQQDSRSVFRRLDPDQYYLVYGDDSVSYKDTDSQGKLYVRVDWDESHAMWGNFNTAFTGTEFAPFNRSLYGGRYLHRSRDNTELGDSKTEVSAFASDAQTAFRHNEFTGTGGSLYYLRDQDIVRGSEKVWVEVRRDGSEQVLSRIPLVAGRDYEIDEFQGRLILNRPLLSVSAQSGPSIIRDEPLEGENTYLIVDYEYLPDTILGGTTTTVGARLKRWLGNHLGVGATWVNDDGASGYEVGGVDVTIKKSDDTYLRVEAARSESGQALGSFFSDDGGLTFEPFDSNNTRESGTAFGVEARVDLDEISDAAVPATIAAWAKRRSAGFSTASTDTTVDTTDVGLEAVAKLAEGLSLSTRITRLEKAQQSRDFALSVEGEYQYTHRLALSAAYRFVDNHNLSANTEGSGDLIAGKVSYKLTDRLSGFFVGQKTVDTSGTYKNNDLYTIGGEYSAGENLTFSAELNTGDRGESASIGADWQVSDTYSLYANSSTAFDLNNRMNNTVTLGQRKTLSNSLKVYTEHQFSREDERAGQSHTLGIDKNFNRYASGGLSVQFSTLEDEAGNQIDREAVSGSFKYQRNRSHWGSKLEFRQDRGLSLDVNQWVTTNTFEHRQSDALRMQGKLNASITKDQISTEQDARFVESGLGFALRPVSHDRLNLLGRLTYLYDLPPLSQSSSSDERAIVYSFEGLYELTEKFSVGGKLGQRKGEVRSDRESGTWSGNDASLAAMRFGYKVPFGLDAMVTYHWLKSEASDDLRQGALVTAGKTVGENLQISLGYNFTSFDDDLTSEDYNVDGWFINLVGKY